MDDFSRTETDPDAASATPRETPESVGRYRVVGQVGQGSHGVVFEAHDPDLDRRVALKVLKSAVGAHADIRQARFMREAQAIAQLTHPNVVSVFDIGEDGGEIFIAMELVDGRSLKDWLLENKPSPQAIFDVFVQAGEGLAAAHAKGIVHRDFKPSNVLVGTDGAVRVADFGLARSLEAGEPKEDGEDAAGDAAPTALSDTVTVAGSIMGTPAYMAPEQLAGKPVDARADQFAFCVSFYEALAWARPFKDVLESDGTVPPIPRERRIGKWLEAALRRGLAFDPADRHESLQALLDHLRNRQRRRRRWVTNIAVASSVALAGGLVMQRLLEAPDGPVCRGFEAQLETAWDDGARARARQSVLATGATLATNTWDTLNGKLDAYGTTWLHASVDSCEATHVRGEQSAELLDVRTMCLRRRLAELGALVTLLGNADAELVSRATEAVSRLTPVARCNETAMLDRAAPPVDKRQMVEALDQQVARLRALYFAGEYSDGNELAARVVAQARDVGFAPIVADALYWHGKHAHGADDYEQAARALDEALLTADAGRHDRLRLSVYVAMIEQDDGTPRSAAQIDRHAKHARHLLARLDRDELLEADIAHAISVLRGKQHAYREAHTEAQKALEIRERLLSADHPDRMQALRRLGKAKQALGLREEATVLYRKALGVAKDKLGETHPYVGLLQNEAGSAFTFLGKHDVAEEYLRLALASFRSLYGEQHSKTAGVWNNLGGTLWNQNRYDETLEAWETARAIYQTVHGPAHRQVGKMEGNIALAHHRLGDLDKAEAAFRRGFDIYNATFGPRHVATAIIQGQLAGLIGDRGDPAEAVRLYVGAFDIMQAANPEHPRLLDLTRGIADNLVRVNRADEALVYLEKGLLLSKVVDEAPKYTAELELMAAQALVATNGDRTRARQLATSARDRVSGLPHTAALHQQISDWLDAQR